MSGASRDYFDECQRELNNDPEYRIWLDTVDKKFKHGSKPTNNLANPQTERNPKWT